MKVRGKDFQISNGKRKEEQVKEKLSSQVHTELFAGVAGKFYN